MYLISYQINSQHLHLPSSSNWLNLGQLDIEGNSITLEAQFIAEARPLVLRKWDILSKHENTTNVNYFLRPNNFGITTYNSGVSGPTTFFNLIHDEEIELNRLNHVAATYNGNKIKLYFNGCVVDSINAQGNLYQNDFFTGLGQRWIIEDEQFVGFLDEVRVWNVARTEDEIRNNMFSNLQENDNNGLVAYYQFEDGYINAASPGTFDGVPVGNPVITFNPDFKGINFDTPLIEIEYNCNQQTASVIIPNDDDYTYLLDNEASVDNIWDDVPIGDHIVDVTHNQWCIDTLIMLNIIPNFSNYNITIDTTLCVGDTIFFNDIPYYQTGSYVQTLASQSIADCDTTLFLNIEFEAQQQIQLDTTLCQDEVLVINNISYTQSGTYIQTLPGETLAHCDTSLIINLSYNVPLNINVDTTLCAGETLEIYNLAFTNPGIYLDTLYNPSLSPCPIHITVNIGAIEEVIIAIDTTICQGEVVVFHDNILDSAGFYTILNQQQNTCDTLYFLNLETIQISTEVTSTSANCFENIGGTMTIQNINGGAMPYEFAIDNSEYSSDNTFENLDPGTYTYHIRDANGCVYTEELIIEDYFADNLLTIDSTNFQINLGDSFTPFISSNYAIDSIYWSNTHGLSCDNCINPSITALENQVYTIYIVDSLGCIQSLSFSAEVQKTARYYIPNVITPLSNDINHKVVIYTNAAITEITSMRIYDRWGNLIFESLNFPPNAPTFGWDGFSNGNIVSQGVYTYHVVFRCLDNTSFESTGTITLLH